MKKVTKQKIGGGIFLAVVIYGGMGTPMPNELLGVGLGITFTAMMLDSLGR